MKARDTFINAIAASPYDDMPRLAFADWLDEHDDHKRAEFIRVQCELEPIRDQYEIAHSAELHDRETELLWPHQKVWLGKMPKGWNDSFSGASIEFRRGFPDTLALPVRTFLQFGAAIRKLHPTIRRVVLFRVNEYGERLTACEALEGLPEIELACWYSIEDAKAIARSEHLKRLQVLVYWLGSEGHGFPDVRRCRIFGASKAWPDLRELILLNPYNEKERTRKQLVKTTNTAAKRNVAVYRLGYPKLFPFAADFFYTFPGYLPNGRAAMANEDFTTDPPSLCVITFDRKGKQTKDVIRIPAPDDLLAVPVSEWYLHKNRLQQQLIDVLGFQPGFIRIQYCQFPGDDFHSYNSPYPEMTEYLGHPDSDDDESWDMEPTGYGGETWRHIYNGDWIFGWDRYGDKRGRIHST